MMRMVCDSSYIIDQSTNYQTKVDELRNILAEILEIDGEKVVIFSQWSRMNDLVVKELDAMGVQYRYLHGGVPGKNRGALYTEFNQNPEVRVFISTDAGGVGLNLQSAAWLINLDIPWNPGVLEQRIGRIYRLGQEKSVNIINLVAQGTIEHNMLGVLQFKKSMAAGVLDDGEDVIFMGDSKFKQFMASVETITRDTMGEVATIEPDEMEKPNVKHDEPEEIPAAAQGIPEIEPVLPDDLDQPDDMPEPAPARNTAAASSPEALVQNGIQFFSQLAKTLSDPDATQRLVKNIVQKDENTGQTYVRLPIENEQAVEGVLNLIGGLFKAMSGQK
jgi:superfamily II DNA/RNA helicase